MANKILLRGIFLVFILCIATQAMGQEEILEEQKDLRIEKAIQQLIKEFQSDDESLQAGQLTSWDFEVNEEDSTLAIDLKNVFKSDEWTAKKVDKIYSYAKKQLPDDYDGFRLTILSNTLELSEWVPYSIKACDDPSILWGKKLHKGEPWVKNISKKYHVTNGLEDRHISLWASHGYHYNQGRGYWKWQRASLFGTTEDLYTQTIVIPYLIPMLEKAGAIVFTPRERDWQKHEIIVDNDEPYRKGYSELGGKRKWELTEVDGFAMHEGFYVDGENPFVAGTAKMTKTTRSNALSYVSYKPTIPEDGDYAVYVSYQTLPESIDDAHYIVYHQGEKTEFRVNQTMGGGTWVYLGTFRFEKGCSQRNQVVITNASSQKGVVTTDAVRFGGGMGNVLRADSISGMPRCLEGARYYAQWAGAPYEVYSSKNGIDDYSDDINVRSYMTNWLAGGSAYVPNKEGKNVPLELALAIHSDAGCSADSTSLYGSLTICSTDFDEGLLCSGLSRKSSLELANALLHNVKADITHAFGKWRTRRVLDKNYSESRRPDVPAVIFETLSHQNFPDMRLGQNPHFKFTLARSIYKTILRYMSEQYDYPYVVAPLAPENISAEFVSNGKLKIEWDGVNDPQELTAKPKSYIVYQAKGSDGFDHGTIVKRNSHVIELSPNTMYHFKVAALNDGGESFCTEEITAYYNPLATRNILIANGFRRLSAPAVFENDSLIGFDLDEDIGVTAGKTAGWLGRQVCFTKSTMGTEGIDALGFSTNELAGKFIAGNDFNYIAEHANAVVKTGLPYNISSCSVQAIEKKKIELGQYDVVDLLLGLEKFDAETHPYYTTFSPRLQQSLADYTAQGGSVLVSGAHIASGKLNETGKSFLANVLKINQTAVNRVPLDTLENTRYDTFITGMKTEFEVYRVPNEQHYAAQVCDVISPVNGGFCMMTYDDGTSAAVAYDGTDHKSIAMGFPFECIKSKKMQADLMKGLLLFLSQSNDGQNTSKHIRDKKH